MIHRATLTLSNHTHTRTHLLLTTLLYPLRESLQHQTHLVHYEHTRATDSLASFREDNSHSNLINDLLIKDVINKSHLQLKLPSPVIKIFIGRDIIPQRVLCLPASKERETRPQLHLNCILLLPQVTCRNVPDLIAVVHVLSRGWEEGLVRPDGCLATLRHPLEVVP